MNKEAFDAALSALQAQLDAAERVLDEAAKAYAEAQMGFRDAHRDLRRHVTYGKHMGWIERAKRAKREEPVVAEAAE